MADAPMDHRDIDDDKSPPFRRMPAAPTSRSSSTVMGLAIGALAYPVTTLAKTLMQVGYEPVPPIPGVSIFRRQKCYYYPNLFSYVNHLRVTEGFSTLFTGLSPKLLSILTSNMVEGLTNSTLKETFPNRTADGEAPPRLRSFGSMLYEVGIDCITRSVGVVCSQPFHVVMLRMICSIINKDKAYQGVLSSAREIYQTEGVSGFFSGLFPRFTAEVLTVAATGVGVWFTYRVLDLAGIQDEVADNMGANYAGAIHFFWYGYVYPYYVTSTVYATMCPGLTHSSVTYPSWRGCYSALKAGGQLSRGQSTFFRVARV